MGYYTISEEGRSLRADGCVFEAGDKLPEEYVELMEPFVEYVEEPEPEPEIDLVNIYGDLEVELEEVEGMLVHIGGGHYELENGTKLEGRGKTTVLQNLAEQIKEGDIELGGE